MFVGVGVRETERAKVRVREKKSLAITPLKEMLLVWSSEKYFSRSNKQVFFFLFALRTTINKNPSGTDCPDCLIDRIYLGQLFFEKIILQILLTY